MSGVHSDDDRPDDLTERYRAASAADPAAPSDAVRKSIFAYARTVAADSATHRVAAAARHRPAANDWSWRISAAASVIVAGFATLLAWHWHAPRRVPEQEPSPSSSQVAAHNPPATAPGVSVERSEASRVDRQAGTAPAPNSVTTRSRQRANATAEYLTHNGAVALETEGSGVVNSQAPAGPAAGSVARNGATDLSAIDAERKRENQAAGAPAAPSAALAPPKAQADTAASARSSSMVPNPALVAAAESGNRELVDQLLRSGISTEQTDARGRTALLVATLRGDMTMARRLLAAGARADAADDSGDTPLAAARRQGPPELARLLESASHP
jgi:hypothetical protein